MKRIEQFKCDCCGTLYSDKSECVKCESQHVKCARIEHEYHLPYKVSAKYPQKVRIVMSDGTVQLYERRKS